MIKFAKFCQYLRIVSLEPAVAEATVLLGAISANWDAALRAYGIVLYLLLADDAKRGTVGGEPNGFAVIPMFNHA